MKKESIFPMLRGRSPVTVDFIDTFFKSV